MCFKDFVSRCLLHGVPKSTGSSRRFSCLGVDEPLGFDVGFSEFELLELGYPVSSPSVVEPAGNSVSGSASSSH